MGCACRAVRHEHGGRAMTRPSRSAANYLTVVLLVWAALIWIITS
jgi:hypothetical protein